MNSPPVTPQKKRILTEINGLPTPKRTKVKERHATTVYSQVKTVFQRGSLPDIDTDGYSLHGRSKEANILKSFLEKGLADLESNSLYISGPPGTGKTAQLNAVLAYLFPKKSGTFNTYQIEKNGQSISRLLSVSKINCMTINRPDEIYHSIYRQIQSCNIFHDAKCSSEQLEKILSDEDVADMHIIVLDELDNLIAKNQRVLFQLFSWASHLTGAGGPRLILIGIANALDLTDRFIPRLKTNGISPNLLQFHPYNGDQIKTIITKKIQCLPHRNTNQIIHPAALQLCARKASSSTGDLRKAFDVLYQSIELAEASAKRKMDPIKFANLQLHEIPPITVAEIAKAFNASNLGKGKQFLAKLNIQQKTILCALSKCSGNKSITINSLYEFYKTKIDFDPLTGSLKKTEFIDILSMLESHGVISMGNNSSRLSNVGNSKVACITAEHEIRSSIQNLPLLEKIMNG
ncbi:ATP-binding protein [Komagataella phaffii CBS 7435]|uniref:Cell division control protein n=2 Tax=Komagataella phaffii TaxID=460519 RepID=C4R510_KOMPG|nr:Essential ATP-binding protein required for DNA replication, component of the pre-replicative complex [Komagataella phaffii GS115]AOA64017.1 GQ67_03675T0 [Komagataella phaffii]CAH2449585.1 ATP-binding protein [Komagataella phaffii CBS 7435]AOA69292.1 GQ68_03647T0 [Komagataella phaffii GS115]CAY70646.1 Essential ATP-binding protein required for DNA replication, component of the pre-replicative complex [Komagataella phaffii GS115]CCA39564.1 ATP-binding protein [Komagataella phaffii CBS 7435]